jgi:hypothetical protein
MNLFWLMRIKGKILFESVWEDRREKYIDFDGLCLGKYVTKYRDMNYYFLERFTWENRILVN